MAEKDDGWCADNAVAPALAMQAHSAPLGLAFYETVGGDGAFRADADGDCFVAFHGSWNRDIPTGYKVVRVRFADGAPASIEDLRAAHDGDGEVAQRPAPVDAVFDGRGRLVVSDDGANTVFRISAAPATARETPAPTTTTRDGAQRPATRQRRRRGRRRRRRRRYPTTATSAPLCLRRPVHMGDGGIVYYGGGDDDAAARDFCAAHRVVEASCAAELRRMSREADAPFEAYENATGDPRADSRRASRATIATYT
ncbi:pyrroloquinoline quinone binding protein [Aureococcus anophagefferens]|uniref:Pyrroloquinoline quinone binding protein n=1 Tax=Aureococcus anophagefferens TaxID=44056 RepID=A0ABR1G0M7_AURAN